MPLIVIIKRGMLSLFPRYLFRTNPTFFSAGEATGGENNNLKIVLGNFDILAIPLLAGKRNESYQNMQAK